MPFLDEKRWFAIYNNSSLSIAKSPVVFLDRDGVIIVEKHYLRHPEQVELYPGVVEKIESLRRLKIPIVVVTNQSGIGQGLFGWSDYDLVHDRMLDLLGMDKPFTAVYANAYQSSEKEALWRKPNPGMFLQAAADLNICLESSVMVGDKWVDLEAATCAGVKHLVHVETGHGHSERSKVTQHFPKAELISSLADFKIGINTL